MARKPTYNLTGKQAFRAIEWFKAVRELQDWQVSIWLDANPPSWVEGDSRDLDGQVAIDRNRKQARIWVDVPCHKRDERDPLATLFHECEHIAFADAGINDRKDGPAHALVYQMGRFFADAYHAGAGPRR